MAEKAGWQGRVFEDFEIGDVYRHPFGRTITEADNIWFTLLTMNTNPTHVDAALAVDTPFGKPLVNSCLTLAIVAGLSVIDTSLNAVANLAWTDISLPNPVFNGDTIYAQSEVLGKRESSSRPYAGIVDIKSVGYKADGTIVLEYKRTFMVYRRGHGHGKGVPAPVPLKAKGS